MKNNILEQLNEIDKVELYLQLYDKTVVDKEEISAVTKVLESGMLAEGKVSREFEKRFQEYIGTKFATVTNNGTTALVAALEAMEIQPGDEIIGDHHGLESPDRKEYRDIGRVLVQEE